MKQITPENACDILLVSQQYSANLLKSISMDFIIKNISKIYKTKEYEKLES